MLMSSYDNIGCWIKLLNLFEEVMLDPPSQMGLESVM